ncbi:MAG TPA: AI-2E family transporter [Rheinheimera sp.]|nr:AI-2E family transporter [Rheinheimera sp.]
MREQMEHRFFIGMLALVTIGFGSLMQPFWTAIFWACAFTVIFYPLQQLFLRKVSAHRGYMALLTILTMILMVLVPLLVLGSSLAHDGVAFYARVQSGEVDPAKWVDAVKGAFPNAISALQELGIDTDNLKTKLSELAMAASKVLATEMLSVGQNAAGLFLNITLMLYLCFFLLKDGPQLVDILIRALPLGDERERHLLDKFAEVTRATVKGNLVVAVVQGTLGGLIFWFLAIPAPLLWGVLMTLLSLLPAVGAALVWLPVSLYLYATGQVVQATILAVYGAVVIGLADNILRPILVGRDTKLPDYLVLFSTLGGISVFGMHGFVLGPLVAALFLAFWQIFTTEFYEHGQQPVEPTAGSITDSTAGSTPSVSD